MKNTLKIATVVALTAAAFSTTAQNKKALAATEMTANYTAVEAQEGQKKSPAMEATRKIGEKTVTVKYSAPSVRERKVWGELVPYDKVWRTGANNATTITFSAATMVEGKEVAAGTYALFTIPGEKTWKVILNTEAKQWGAYDYDAKKDVLNVEVTPSMVNESMEQLNFSFNDQNSLVFAWEKLRFSLKMK